MAATDKLVLPLSWQLLNKGNETHRNATVRRHFSPHHGLQREPFVNGGIFVRPIMLSWPDQLKKYARIIAVCFGMQAMHLNGGTVLAFRERLATELATYKRHQ